MTTATTTEGLTMNNSNPNAFDFWEFKLVSKTIRPLVAAGVARDKIKSEFSHWETFGRNRYRRHRYEVILAYVDAPKGHDAMRAKYAELSAAYPTLTVSSVYVAVD